MLGGCHRHEWKKIEETYAPPTEKLSGMEIEGNPHEVQQIIMGVTTILWECKVCKKKYKEEILGKTTKNNRNY